jgi:hypothetical protein
MAVVNAREQKPIKVRIERATIVAGKPARRGDEMQLEPALALQLIHAGKAVRVEAPEAPAKAEKPAK